MRERERQGEKIERERKIKRRGRRIEQERERKSDVDLHAVKVKKVNFRFHGVPRKASAREPEVVTIGFLASEREPRGGYRLPSITANDQPGSRSISDMPLPGVSIHRRRDYLSVATGGRLSSRLVVNKDSGDE